MQEQGRKKDEVKEVSKDNGRRKFLKTAATAGAAVAASTAVGPFIQTAKAKTTVWKFQTVWDAGTSGYTLFENWCNGMIEKSGARD